MWYLLQKELSTVSRVEMGWGETVVGSTPKTKMLLMWVLRDVGLAETESGVSR